jgi:hypothetical protein
MLVVVTRYEGGNEVKKIAKDCAAKGGISTLLRTLPLSRE